MIKVQNLRKVYKVGSEKVVALDNIKNRLKWKRPVSSKEKETYTLVERKLFSKEFQAKYFI